MNHALITGGGGFLGRHVAAALAGAGWQVTSLRRDHADVTARGALLARARPAALLVHLAFPTDAAARHARPVDALRAAAAGAANALALAVRCGAIHVIVASSGKVYGAPRLLPTPEDHPVAPTTWLGWLKANEEAIAATFGRGAGVGVTALRVFNAWGPGQRADFVVPRLVAAWRAAGEGGGPPLRLGELDHGRDYVHATDVARAVVAAAAHPPAPGTARAWNVGTGHATTVRGLAAALTRVTGRRVPLVRDPTRLRPAEPREEAARCDALRALGWLPRVSLHDGLRELVGRRP